MKHITACEKVLYKQKGLVEMEEIKNWNVIVGENIRRLRMQNRETQMELGKMIGYGATTVANYESGERMPDLVTAYMIAMHYHISMEELLKDPLHES